MMHAQLPHTHAHETPTKRRPEQDPLTADSNNPLTPTTPLTPISPQQHHSSLAELDARDLFEKFAQLVVVREEETGEDFEDEVARKLDYEHPHTLRLTFDTSSMKKKPLHRAPAPFAGINLFQILPERKEAVQVESEACDSPVRCARGVWAEAEWAARKEDRSG